MSIYAAGEIDLDWERETRFLNKQYPIVVFSKTYCPYSKRAKELLAAYNIQPTPKIVEVDMRDDNNVIKLLLSRLTHHSTFPNILIQGKSIGGSDDLIALHNDRTLAKMLERAGVTIQSDLEF
ncbi:glutaredoxin [Laccaria bicolor S238N-H82]|uniref:Glutaredoxin n=1 Tax=Laccaria bicolor (strain S238N-H82 / ATCC MYA-4686) TaxID=486041 RepID=B0D132_LACBS|nr:glutaredoxin [Laccaria bicolor S238N-H82]EDR11931.1 glutaredoxin [Laccaria bicolor S238N-H82]|eukprot:XP_001877828.1 glutaredoxin [Laccaria bicolor S238N-H82]